MKKIFITIIFSLVAYGLLGIISEVRAVPATVKPGVCPAGTTFVDLPSDANLARGGGYQGLCIPNGFTNGYIAYNSDYRICTFPDWIAKSYGGIIGCCPPGWIEYTLPGFQKPYRCCPPEYSDNVEADHIQTGNATCSDNVLGNWNPPDPIIINGESIDVYDGSASVPGYDYIMSFDAFLATIPLPTLLSRVSRSDDIFGCFTVENYCMIKARDLNPDELTGPSFLWSYDPLWDPRAHLFPGAGTHPQLNAQPFDSHDNGTTFPECVRTCDSNNSDWMCLPQVGWVRRTADWKTLLNLPAFSVDDPTSVNPVDMGLMSSWTDLYNLLCEAQGNIREPLPAGVDPDGVEGSCGKIIKDNPTPDNIAEYNSCLQCEFIDSNGDGEIQFDDPSERTGYIWSEIGCVSATVEGITNRIFQIAVGIIGAVIIYRVIQIVIILNTGEPGPDKMEEVREIGLSIVMFVIVTTGAVVILRFLGGNILGIPFFL